MKNGLLIVILVLGFTSAAGVTRAEVSDKIPVGGLLTDLDGQALDGDYDMAFGLYESATGGTAIWSEVNQVTVDDGLFSVQLGSITTIDFLDLIEASDLWLGITVGADSEADRIPIGTVPYAMEAQYCHTVLDATCPEGQYLRGWDETTGEAICEAAGGVPAGTVLPFGGSTPPNGYLLCDGTSYHVSTYPELYAAIGTAWGTVDGNHFNVPDLQGRFLRGVDNGTGRDPDAATRTATNVGGNVGDNVGSIQGRATALPNAGFVTTTNGAHIHDIYGGYRCVGGASGDLRGAGSGTGVNSASGGNHSHSVTGGDAETRPVNTYVNYMIKF